MICISVSRSLWTTACVARCSEPCALVKRCSVHPKTMIQRQAVVIALAATVAAWQPATRINSRATPLKMSEQLTDEEEAEIIANAQKIAKKKRSNLYNEDGVAYAPWMVRQVDEDAAAARAMRGYEKRRERIALEEKQGTINMLDAASSELTGLGLKAKVLSEDEVDEDVVDGRRGGEPGLSGRARSRPRVQHQIDAASSEHHRDHGLKAKVLSATVELTWSTDDEEAQPGLFGGAQGRGLQRLG